MNAKGSGQVMIRGTIYLDPDMMVEVEEMALKYDKSIAKMLRTLVTLGLENFDPAVLSDGHNERPSPTGGRVRQRAAGRAPLPHSGPLNPRMTNPPSHRTETR